MSRKQWSHITIKHPFMFAYEEEIKETLKNPDKIIDYGLDESVRYYYKYYKHKKGKNKYLMTLVKYLNGSGFIISSYFEDKIKWKKSITPTIFIMMKREIF